MSFLHCCGALLFVHARRLRWQPGRILESRCIIIFCMADDDRTTCNVVTAPIMWTLTVDHSRLCVGAVRQTGQTMHNNVAARPARCDTKTAIQCQCTMATKIFVVP